MYRFDNVAVQCIHLMFACMDGADVFFFVRDEMCICM